MASCSGGGTREDPSSRTSPPQTTALQIDVKLLHPHDLAHHLHTSGHYFLLDCRPLLAYNTCHITGAVNINITGMMKKRFVSGKIGLADLVTTEEGREKFKTCADWPTVVYDEATADVHNISKSNHVWLVVNALEKMGKCPFLLQGGLSEFNVLHPSLCEISLPTVRRRMNSAATPLRATTPGMRDQPLDWKTAPPVHVLSYLVLGSEKDAKSKEVFKDFGIGYVLNVTPKCPNYFEDRNVVYKRIVATDTGSQKLSHTFMDAFEFIEKARLSNSCILIHCMAGISRSVTLTLAYLMYHFGLSMQDAYQYVKDKRPAISPNLNFMGQLVTFEKELDPARSTLTLEDYLPSPEQIQLTEKMKQCTSSGSSNENTPEARKGTAEVLFESRPLFLKLPPPPKKMLLETKLDEVEKPDSEMQGMSNEGVQSERSSSLDDDVKGGTHSSPTSGVQNFIQQFEKLTTH